MDGPAGLLLLDVRGDMRARDELLGMRLEAHRAPGDVREVRREALDRRVFRGLRQVPHVPGRPCAAVFGHGAGGGGISCGAWGRCLGC